MKRFIISIVLSLCVIMLAACARNDQTQPSASPENSAAVTPTAIVTEEDSFVEGGGQIDNEDEDVFVEDVFDESEGDTQSTKAPAVTGNATKAPTSAPGQTSTPAAATPTDNSSSGQSTPAETAKPTPTDGTVRLPIDFF